METQKIWAFEEIRLFHCGCQVHSWVDWGNLGLNLQPGLAQTTTYAPKRTRTDARTHRNGCHHHENHQHPVTETRCHVATSDVAPKWRTLIRHHGKHPPAHPNPARWHQTPNNKRQHWSSFVAVHCARQPHTKTTRDDNTGRQHDNADRERAGNEGTTMRAHEHKSTTEICNENDATSDGQDTATRPPSTTSPQSVPSPLPPSIFPLPLPSIPPPSDW